MAPGCPSTRAAIPRAQPAHRTRRQEQWAPGNRVLYTVPALCPTGSPGDRDRSAGWTRHFARTAASYSAGCGGAHGAAEGSSRRGAKLPEQGRQRLSVTAAASVARDDVRRSERRRTVKRVQRRRQHQVGLAWLPSTTPFTLVQEPPRPSPRPRARQPPKVPIWVRYVRSTCLSAAPHTHPSPSLLVQERGQRVQQRMPHPHALCCPLLASTHHVSHERSCRTNITRTSHEHIMQCNV